MSTSLWTPTGISERIILMEGWRAHLLALVSGGLSALSLAPFHLFPILIFTIPVFVWLLDGAVAPVGARGLRRMWPAFRTGWLFGLGYFTAGLWWVGNAFLVDADGFLWLLPFAVLGLPAGLAIFWGIGASLARLGWGNGWVRLVTFAASLTLAEFTRGTILTGFPWNLPGYALMPNALMMQSSALIGTYGLTFVTLFCAASPAIFAPNNSTKPRRVRLVLLAALGLLVAHIGYGNYVLSRAQNAVVANVKLRLVQPNIDQRSKWDADKAAGIFRTYLDLSKTNAGPQTAGPGAFSHIIWPESAFPFILAEQPQALRFIADLLPSKTVLITGGMRREPPTANRRSAIYNSALVLNGDGEIIASQDKTQLVPFGEFMPFQTTLENMGIQQLTKLPGGFAAGTARAPISTGRGPAFLPLICYEIVYPGALASSSERPGWLINLTNDAWFGQTSGPYQHAHQTLVRAAEEGLPIVRVANSGISFVSDAYGRITEQLPLNVAAVIDADLPIARAPTPIARFGNMPIIVFICALFFLLVGLTQINTIKLQ